MRISITLDPGEDISPDRTDQLVALLRHVFEIVMGGKVGAVEVEFE